MMMRLVFSLIMLSLGAVFVPVSAQAGQTAAPQIMAEAETDSVILSSIDRETKDPMRFIDSVARRGIGFLSDPAMTPERRKSAFRALLRDSFDLTTIGRFALGKYWRVATPGQRTEYQRLFEKMVIDVYIERFSTYDGQQLKTTGVKQLDATDAIVNSYVMPTNGGEKVRVDWRVRMTNGRYRVVDVVVEGVSMSVTQRSDFSSVIQRGGGDVAVLIDHLRHPVKK